MSSGSEVVTGVFENVETKTAKDLGKKGNWAIYNAVVNGKKYGLGFSKDLFSEIPAGQVVKLTVSKDDKGYWKVDSVEKLDSLPSTPTTSSNPTSGTDYSQVDRREALRIAATVVNATYDSPHAKTHVKDFVRVNRIVAWADHFVNYIQTGKLDPVDVEVVKKLDSLYKE